MLMYIAVKSQGSEETFIGTAVYSRCWQFCSENASISSFYIPRRVLIRTLGIGIAHVASWALVLVPDLCLESTVGGTSSPHPK